MKYNRPSILWVMTWRHSGGDPFKSCWNYEWEIFCNLNQIIQCTYQLRGRRKITPQNLRGMRQIYLQRISLERVRLMSLFGSRIRIVYWFTGWQDQGRVQPPRRLSNSYGKCTKFKWINLMQYLLYQFLFPYQPWEIPSILQCGKLWNLIIIDSEIDRWKNSRRE